MFCLRCGKLLRGGHELFEKGGYFVRECQGCHYAWTGYEEGRVWFCWSTPVKQGLVVPTGALLVAAWEAI